MSNISAVVITRNEERNIARCLEALRQVCTDIVVVDALSTDRTPDICRDCGVRLFQKEWENYSANKNFGNAQARHDWVLSIDADEVLSPELVATLQNLQPQTGCVYALDRLNNYCGVWVRHSGWYPNWKVRLFDRRHVHWEGDYVHERLVWPPGTQILRLRGKLWHYTYAHPAEHDARIERYARLAARELFERGCRPGALKRLTAPAVRFLRTFIWKGGFLDGRVGWLLSCKNARLMRRRYELLEELWAQAEAESINPKRRI